jgi:hypothetical protein
MSSDMEIYQMEPTAATQARLIADSVCSESSGHHLDRLGNQMRRAVLMP